MDRMVTRTPKTWFFCPRLCQPSALGLNATARNSKTYLRSCPNTNDIILLEQISGTFTASSSLFSNQNGIDLATLSNIASLYHLLSKLLVFLANSSLVIARYIPPLVASDLTFIVSVQCNPRDSMKWTASYQAMGIHESSSSSDPVGHISYDDHVPKPASFAQRMLLLRTGRSRLVGG